MLVQVCVGRPHFTTSASALSVFFREVFRTSGRPGTKRLLASTKFGQVSVKVGLSSAECLPKAVKDYTHLG